jgi:DNA-binding MarR family transcriptional regulator
LTSQRWTFIVHAMNKIGGGAAGEGLDRDGIVVLEILKAVEAEENLTQRDLARRLGVALGLANSYLRRCARKGLIKVRQVPAKRYLYYLTPKGFAEKSRLTTEYLKFSFDFYRLASSTCGEVFAACHAAGGRRALLAGASELAEIATLRAADEGIELVAVHDAGLEQNRFAGLPVVRRIEDAPPFDHGILTDLVNPVERYRELVEAIGNDRTVVPGVLAPALRHGSAR